MKKALSIMLMAIMAISAVILVLVFALPNDMGVGYALTWTYILVGIAVLSAVVFPIVNLIQNPKAALHSLLGLGIVVVVVGVAFALSSAEPMTLSGNTVYDDTAGLRVADAGLYTAYFALVAALVVTIAGEIRNSLK